MEQITITFASPSGGIGKSLLSREIAVASALTRLGGEPIKTCLVDLNLYNGSQNTFFKIRPKYSIMDLVDEFNELRQTMSFSEIDRYFSEWENIEKFFVYVQQYNLYVLPSPSDSEPHTISLMEMRRIEYYLQKQFDVVIFDTANNCQPETLAAIRLADVPILIVTDEERTVRRVIDLKRRFREEGFNAREIAASNDELLQRLRRVVNRYPTARTDRYFSIDEIEHNTRMNEIAVLHEEKHSWMLANLGNLVVLDVDRNPLKKEILDLGHYLIPDIDVDAFYR